MAGVNQTKKLLSCGRRRAADPSPKASESPFVIKCGGEMNPIIVAPLLRKPIVEDAAIRSAWGLTRMKFESASRVVAIG